MRCLLPILIAIVMTPGYALAASPLTHVELPEAMTDAAVASDGQTLFVFGGAGAHGPTDRILDVSADGVRERSAHLPVPSSGLDAVWIGDRFALLGGDRQGALADELWTYDPLHDKTESVARFAHPLGYVGALWDGHELVILEGADSKGILRVDPTTWAVRADPQRLDLPGPIAVALLPTPNARCAAPCALVLPEPCGLGCEGSRNAIILDLATGTQENAQLGLPAHCCAGVLRTGQSLLIADEWSGPHADPENQLFQLDAATFTLKPARARLPGPTMHFGFASDGTDAILVGGLECGHGGGCAPVDWIARLREDGSVLFRGRELPIPIGDAASTVWRGKLVLAGGTSLGQRLDTVFSYDPTTGTTALYSVRLPAATEASGALPTDHGVDLFGGLGDAGVTAQIVGIDLDDARVISEGTLPSPAAGAAAVRLAGGAASLFGGFAGGHSLASIQSVPAGHASSASLASPLTPNGALSSADGTLLLGGATCGAGCGPARAALLRAPDGQTREIPLVTPVARAAVAVRGDGAFLVGGCKTACAAASETAEIQFVTSHGASRVSASLPLPTSGAAAAYLDDHLVVLGGMQPETSRQIVSLSGAKLEPRSSSTPGPAAVVVLGSLAIALVIRGRRA